MDGLEGNTFISSFNGVDGLENLFKGGQEEADLRNKNLDKYEAVVPVARLLLRSEATLTKLDLRYCSQEQNMCWDESLCPFLWLIKQTLQQYV